MLTTGAGYQGTPDASLSGVRSRPGPCGLSRTAWIAAGAGVVVVLCLGIGLGVGLQSHATGALVPTMGSAVTWAPGSFAGCGGQPWSITGSVEFSQAGGEEVTVRGDLSGLPPSSLHGFHVHGTPSTAGNCTAAGGHWNPFSRLHGGPTNTISARHVGDLGNILTDSNGHVSFTLTDSIISLTNSSRNILGLVVVVHCLVDDLGLGGSPHSNTTGNAGARVACAIIERR